MHETPILIVGGGLASARAVRAYREAGGSEPITLLSADESPPYHRPPLSKAYLRGEIGAGDTLVEEPAYYAEHGVDVRLATTVTAVSPRSRSVQTEAGEIGYDRLLIATGARPRRLALPGSELAGIHYLRSLADSTAIRKSVRDARTAVVVGGGFIGMEVSASLRRLGVAVTLVHLGAGLFDTLGSRPLSKQLAQLFEANSVELALDEQVTGFHGNGRVDSVSTSGGRELPADLVVIGIGVEPVVDLLEGSGLAISDGIDVDERLQTSDPHVMAAGDVAAFPDAISGRRRRIEHWSNANLQGSEAGRLLAGAPPSDPRVASFFTEVFGTTVRVFGDPHGHEQEVWHGSVANGGAAGIFAGADGATTAAVAAGLDQEAANTITEAIRAGTPIDAVAERFTDAGAAGN